MPIVTLAAAGINNVVPCPTVAKLHPQWRNQSKKAMMGTVVVVLDPARCWLHYYSGSGNGESWYCQMSSFAGWIWRWVFCTSENLVGRMPTGHLFDTPDL